MKKNIIKKNVRTEKKRSEDQTAVILEDIKSQFTVFGEGLSLLSDKADRIETKINVIDRRLIRVEDNIIEVKHKLSEKVDLEDFQKLEKRLIKLEKIVFEKI